MKQKIAEIFNRNIGNTLSLELANGILQSIFEIVQEREEDIKKELNLEGPEDARSSD